MKTQTISRKGIKDLYDNSCQNWQKTITELILFQEGKEIEVEESLITKAYSEANSEQKKLLEKYFTIRSSNIKDRIKTWKDVIEYALNWFNEIPKKNVKTKLQKTIYKAIADYKLNNEISPDNKVRLIAFALNEGWEPNFNNTSEYKYYPYFEKKSYGWVVGSWSCCDVGRCGMGSGYLYKTSDLAIYGGTNFIKEYTEFLPE